MEFNSNYEMRRQPINDAVLTGMILTLATLVSPDGRGEILVMCLTQVHSHQLKYKLKESSLRTRGLLLKDI